MIYYKKYEKDKENVIKYMYWLFKINLVLKKIKYR